VAKGVRRVVGVTSGRAREAHANGELLLERLSALQAEKDPGVLREALTGLQRDLAERIVPAHVRHRLNGAITELQKVVREAEKAQASASGGAVMDRAAALLASARSAGGIQVVVGEVPAAPVDALRGAVDWIRDKAGGAAVLLATVVDGKVVLLAGMSKEAVARGLSAGDWIKELAPLVGGRGGGRPDMAQGGGPDPAGLAQVLERAREWVLGKLG
jgi:alanyl-tRNA synthetase